MSFDDGKGYYFDIKTEVLHEYQSMDGSLSPIKVYKDTIIRETQYYDGEPVTVHMIFWSPIAKQWVASIRKQDEDCNSITLLSSLVPQTELDDELFSI